MFDIMISINTLNLIPQVPGHLPRARIPLNSQEGALDHSRNLDVRRFHLSTLGHFLQTDPIQRPDLYLRFDIPKHGLSAGVFSGGYISHVLYDSVGADFSVLYADWLSRVEPKRHGCCEYQSDHLSIESQGAQDVTCCSGILRAIVVAAVSSANSIPFRTALRFREPIN